MLLAPTLTGTLWSSAEGTPSLSVGKSLAPTASLISKLLNKRYVSGGSLINVLTTWRQSGRPLPPTAQLYIRVDLMPSWNMGHAIQLVTAAAYEKSLPMQDQENFGGDIMELIYRTLSSTVSPLGTLTWYHVPWLFSWHFRTKNRESKTTSVTPDYTFKKRHSTTQNPLYLSASWTSPLISLA